MSVQPLTPHGIRVSNFLHDIFVGREDLSVASIQRVFFSYSEIVVNEDAFVDRLFELEVLPQTAENLKESHRTRESRYKYGIEIACKKKKMREIVAAFEKSDNEHVIDELFERIEGQSPPISVAKISADSLQTKIRMLAYGFKIESISNVTSAPSTTSSSNSTGPSEEPAPRPESPSALESIQDAAMLERLAIVSLEMGECAEAKEKLEKVLNFKERYYGCGSAQLAPTINSLAEAHFGLGDFLAAKSVCEKPLITEPDDVTSVDIVCTLGLTYMEVGRLEEAIGELEGAWDRLNSKPVSTEYGQLTKAKILSLLGIIYSYMDSTEKAKKAVISCLALFGSCEFSPTSEAKVFRIKCYLAYALLLSESDSHDKGLELLQTCVKYFESNYGLNHYKYVEALHLLGYSYGFRVEWKKGLEILQRCVELGNQCYGNDSVAIVSLLHSLGKVYFALNDNVKAVKVFEKSLKIADKFPHPFYEMHRHHCLLLLCEVWTIFQDYQKIKQALQICLGIEKNQKALGRKLTKSVSTLGALDKVYSKLDYQKLDVEFLENNLADEKRLRHRTEFVEDLVLSYKILGKAYGAFGDKAKEREMNEAALETEKGLRRG